jgi:uncharacterized protein YndB with AHSA1/START domain
MNTYASYATIRDQPTLNFERRLSHPVDRVWRAITEPDELAQWFPTQVEADLELGGRMTFTFEDYTLPDGSKTMPGEITELDPPRVLAFQWGEDHLRFELEPVDGDRACVLRFTVVLGMLDKAARDGAGWHVCLDRLERFVSGEDGPAVTGVNGDWRALYEEYQRRGAPAGAPIPGQ